ncbi:MAG TPA: hypothetical protein VNW99_06790 [Cytophagaceae bacterium]|nr:hypothetical protein [Cytophagaceae bacterium]
MDEQFNTPILFLIFNRPETTLKVFEQIRKMKPKYLFISADGPRNKAEEERCMLTRSVKDKVDWPCDVKLRYDDKNLGCKYGVSTGITWFFDQVEEGIIIEDDCLPDLSFFRYAEELLAKYSNDERVMHVGASNFQGKDFKTEDSYYFSLYNHIWGWASWRRAWKHYNVNLDTISNNDFKQKLDKTFERKIDKAFWLEMFKYAKSGNIDTWDYQWMFAIWMNNGIAITPAVNLISNIGFGEGGTNTQIGDDRFSENAITAMKFPLVSSAEIQVSKKSDNYTSDHLFKISERAKTFNLKIKIARIMPIRFKNRLKKIVRGIVN